TPARNMVNLRDKGIPTDCCLEEGKFKHVKWAVKLGGRTYGTPVVADGRVFIAGDASAARDPKVKGPNKAVLLCFAEADGTFLWQAVHDFPPDPACPAFLNLGPLCTPVVEGERLWYVTPAAEVICAETATGKAMWRYDLCKELKVRVRDCCTSAPLVLGDKLFVVTGNGADLETGKVMSPKAPSFVALDKSRGVPVWMSSA